MSKELCPNSLIPDSSPFFLSDCGGGDFLKAKALLLVFLIVAAFGGPIALNVLSAPTVSECVALAGNNFTAGSVDGAIIQPCGEEMDGPGMPT